MTRAAAADEEGGEDMSVTPVRAKTVLILSAASGAGHIRSAEALASAFAARGVPARHVEVLKHTNSLFKRFYSDLYVEMVNRNPDLMGLLYNALDRPWRYQKRRLALDRLNTRPLVKLLKEADPGLVVCTHFLPAEILVHLKREKALDVPVAVVVTDFDGARGHDALRAVERGKGLAQLRHVPADGRLPIHERDLVARVGNIQRSLNARNACADN